MRGGVTNLLNSRTSPGNTQALIGVSIFLLGIWLAWQVGGKIVSNDLRTIEFAVLGCAAIFLLFEDGSKILV